MAEESFESKVTMTNVHATEGSFWVNPEQPSGETRVDANIEVSVPVVERSEGGASTSDVFIAVSVKYSDSGPESVQRASFNVRLSGRITVPPDADDECLTEKWLRAFSVANLYPQAQAYLTVLSGIAYSSGVPLPTIDPDELVATIGQDAAAQ